MAAIAGAVFAGLGALSSILGGRKASKAAKRQAALEAAAESRVTLEKVRRLGIEEKTLRGETIARAAGSGIKADVGSPLMVLAEQAREFAMERRIVQEVGATKAASALQRGQNVATQVKYQSIGAAANQFASMFSLLQKPPGG